MVAPSQTTFLFLQALVILTEHLLNATVVEATSRHDKPIFDPSIPGSDIFVVDRNRRVYVPAKIDQRLVRVIDEKARSYISVEPRRLVAFVDDKDDAVSVGAKLNALRAGVEVFVREDALQKLGCHTCWLKGVVLRNEYEATGSITVEAKLCSKFGDSVRRNVSAIMKQIILAPSEFDFTQRLCSSKIHTKLLLQNAGKHTNCPSFRVVGMLKSTGVTKEQEMAFSARLVKGQTKKITANSTNYCVPIGFDRFTEAKPQSDFFVLFKIDEGSWKSVQPVYDPQQNLTKVWYASSWLFIKDEDFDELLRGCTFRPKVVGFCENITDGELTTMTTNVTTTNLTTVEENESLASVEGVFLIVVLVVALLVVIVVVCVVVLVVRLIFRLVNLRAQRKMRVEKLRRSLSWGVVDSVHAVYPGRPVKSASADANLCLETTNNNDDPDYDVIDDDDDDDEGFGDGKRDSGDDPRSTNEMLHLPQMQQPPRGSQPRGSQPPQQRGPPGSYEPHDVPPGHEYDVPQGPAYAAPMPRHFLTSWKKSR